MKLLSTLLIAHLGLSSVLAGEELPKNEAHKVAKVAVSDFVGSWETVRFWGADSGDFIERIGMVFRKDGTFKATATIKGEGDSSYAGTYSIDGDQLRMKVPKQPDQVAPCYFKEGLLVLGDIELDSWMELKKVPDAKSVKPKAEQGGAEQPATAPESKPEGKKKPKPESEERPQ